jgi:hypothetical protein
MKFSGSFENAKLLPSFSFRLLALSLTPCASRLTFIAYSL